MPRAVLSLEIPDAVWIGAVSRITRARFRVLAATTSDRGGVALLELIAEDPDSVVGEIGDAPAVTDLTVLAADPERVLLQVETANPVFLESARRSGVPIETPFTVRDGQVTWELTTSRDRLSALGEELAAAEIAFTVESVYQGVDSEPLLTDCQWNVLRIALDGGYYDTPRTCTQEDVAAEAGLAKSTCSEILHRAEERIVKRLVEERATGSAGDPPRKVVVG
ncbi:MAG: helix-turn-helix domain-containing protein [Salinigranum sp.]